MSSLILKSQSKKLFPFLSQKGLKNNQVLKIFSLNTRLYHENVIEHYKNPRNVGSFDDNDENVGTGLVGSPACGDVMKLQVKVDKNNKIIDCCFKTFGCASAIASSSYATERLKGKAIDDAKDLTNKKIATHLALPPIKLHCSVLAENAINEAIKDLKKKKKCN